MKPDTSHWRNGETYGYFESLPVEGLAWECLRRYEPYQDDYRLIVRAKTETAPLPASSQMRWGLRFPGATQSFGNGSTDSLVSFGRSQRLDPRGDTRFSSVRLGLICRRARHNARES